MFKPKNQKEQQPQPFYLSWFTNQGENLKRGGTAPHESRKDRLPVKSPYQQPLTTLVHVAPNPYTKLISQPKAYQNHIQQISKIYAGPTKSFTNKRKSQEYGRQRYDQEIQKSGRASLQPTRTFTQQNPRPLRENLRPQTQQKVVEVPCENLINYMSDEEEDEQQLTPRANNNETFEEQQVLFEQNDDYSNRSQEADSDNQQSIHLPTKIQDDNEMLKNKSFVQKQPEDQVISVRKNPTSVNRPQTSEGGRRKRFVNSLNEDHRFDKRDTEHNVLECDYNMIREEEFDQEQEITPEINSPKELKSIRSGQRKNKGQDLQILNSNNRPPSRHKTPPKATDLEIPNTGNKEEIPIKNMYAQLDVKVISKEDEMEELDLDFFKMNNKFNFQNFQREELNIKQNYHSDYEQTNYSHKPQSANLKQNKPVFQNTSFSPHTKPLTSNGLRLTEPQTEIVIKYNTSSTLNKDTNQPVKVPFKTSLGQDFLRLFANNFVD